MKHVSYSRLIEHVFATSAFQRVTKASLSKGVQTEFASHLGPLWKAYIYKNLQHLLTTGSVISRGKYYYYWVSKEPPRQYHFRAKKGIRSEQPSLPLTPPITGITSDFSREHDNLSVSLNQGDLLEDYKSLSMNLLTTQMTLNKELKVCEDLSREQAEKLYEKCILESELTKIKGEGHDLIKYLIKLQLECYFLNNNLQKMEAIEVDDFEGKREKVNDQLEQYEREKVAEFENYKSSLLAEMEHKRMDLVKDHLMEKEILYFNLEQNKTSLNTLKEELSVIEGRFKELSRLNILMKSYLS